jgi:hypothetical protein
VTVNLDCDALRAVLNAKVRDVVQEIVKMAYSRTAIVVGHHHSTHTSKPMPTISTRAPISDDSSASTSEEDLDRKMMPPPPSRPPRNIPCHPNRHHQHNRKRRHVIIAKSLDNDEGSSHHRPKRARMVGPIQRARMAMSA